MQASLRVAEISVGRFARRRPFSLILYNGICFRCLNFFQAANGQLAEGFEVLRCVARISLAQTRDGDANLFVHHGVCGMLADEQGYPG